MIDRWASTRASKQLVPQRKRHLAALIAAIAEFHKAQCYFSAAIQIAAIVFAREVKDVTKEFTSAGILFTIATDSSIPVIFVLVAIQRYGQQSWYLVILSACCLLLSLATLILSNIVFPGMVGQALDYPVQADSCGYHTPSNLLSAWCGSEVTIPGLLNNSTLHSGWNWVLWCNCAVWFGFCFFEKAIAIEPTAQSGIAQSLRKRAEYFSLEIRQAYGDPNSPRTLSDNLVNHIRLSVLPLQPSFYQSANKHNVDIRADCRYNSLGTLHRRISPFGTK